MASTNSVFIQAIVECVQQRHEEVIALLADTYGFDAADATNKISGLTSDDVKIVAPAPKKRGRPPKQVVVKEANDEEDLVASLMANSDENSDKPKGPAKKPKMTPEQREAKKAETKRLREEKAAAAKEAKRVAREQAKAEKAAQKEAEKEQRRIDREKQREAKKTERFEAFKRQKAEKLAAKRLAQQQEQEVEQEDTAQQEESVDQETVQEPNTLPNLQIPPPSSPVTCTELVEEEDSDSDDDAQEVTEFEIDGKTYYRDDEGLVYDNLEEGEVIGTWNASTSTIEPVAEDDEDDEDHE